MQIYPPMLMVPSAPDGYVFDLLGPQTPWYNEAIDALHKRVPAREKLRIIAPLDPIAEHRHSKFIAKNADSIGDYEAWREDSLTIAGKSAEHGCIIIWLSLRNISLGAESSDIHPASHLAVLQETFGLIARLKKDPTIRFAIGGDTTFPHLDAIHYKIQKVVNDPVDIFYDLGNLVNYAVKVAELGHTFSTQTRRVLDLRPLRS